MIRVRDLVHRYDGELALDGVSLTVEAGEWLLLVGANGSGKTTLIRHFNGLLSPDVGEVRVDGTSPTDDPVAARTVVGMVFQSPRDQIVAATVGADVAFGPENLGLDRATIDRHVADALAAVGLSGREDDRVDSLSGGEQARLAVAGALAMDPDYLVLDEPFAGLDWAATRSLCSHLDDLHADGTAIVLVTHDVRDLRERVDRVVGLADGEVVVEGPPDETIEDLAAIDVRVPG